jgi:hypothetical protein
LSLVEAEVTLVAAEATVRGVAREAAARETVAREVVDAPLAAVRAPVAAAFLLPEFVVRAGLTVAARLAAPAVLVALEALAPPAGLAVRLPALARTEPAIRTGAAFLSAVLFVDGTDLPPILTSQRGVSFHGE